MYPRALSCIPVGASHGWVLRTYGNGHIVGSGHNVYLTDVYKPWFSSPRIILLPLLDFEVSFSTKSKAVSLSSDPVQDDDVCVAARFIDSHLSVCRLCDSKWTHIKLPVSLLPVSTLMYSKRDKAFYLTNLKSRYLRLLDLSNNKIKCRYLRLRNIPRISEADMKELDKCHLTQHLVESPSGELIFIRCYTKCIVEKLSTDEGKMRSCNPKRFMVFREDELSKNFYYTEDIGDLCIFLGKSENFSVSLSMYPGLRPNSIYYANGWGVGSYSLDSGKIHPFNVKGLNLGSHWISPS